MKIIIESLGEVVSIVKGDGAKRFCLLGSFVVDGLHQENRLVTLSQLDEARANGIEKGKRVTTLGVLASDPGVIVLRSIG